MEIQNLTGDNKVFIDNSVYKKLSVEDFYPTMVVIKSNKEFTTSFKEEDMIFPSVKTIVYTKDTDCITLRSDNDIMSKKLANNEIISMEIEDGDLIITTFKLPMFMYEQGLNESYPKFDINISDCAYSMKIYLNEHDYIVTPYYQSHSNINSTLDYINSLTYYLTDWNKELLYDLCDNEAMRIFIYDEKNKTVAKGSENYEYRLSEQGIVLFGDTFEDGFYTVDWHKFFKLNMDNKWSVNFIDKNELYPQYTSDIETMI